MASRNKSALSIGIARKGWLTKADVINTLPLEKLRKELAKKRSRK
jgi:DNA polymerase (family 10)